MRFWAGVISCALLAGCQTVQRTPASERAEPDGIAFEVKSWGTIVHSWAVIADGSGTSVTKVNKSGSPWPPYTLEHRRFVLSSGQMAQLRSSASAIPKSVPTDDKCQNRITDAAYGSLSLVYGDETEELAFYEGCFDAYYAPYITQMKAIDALVMDAAAKAPIERREEVAADSN